MPGWYAVDDLAREWGCGMSGAKRNDGGAAFPRACEDESKEDAGMTLRDWFMGQADVSQYHPEDMCVRELKRQPSIKDLAECIAVIRCAESDAMLAERERDGAV